MMRGTSVLELSFLVEDEHLREVAVESCRMPLTRAEERAIWAALPKRLQEKLLDEAAENAEDAGDDDASSDEARMPRSA